MHFFSRLLFCVLSRTRSLAKHFGLELFAILPVVIAFLTPFDCSGQNLRHMTLYGYAQGTSWHLTYYAIDSVVAQQQIDSILQAIDSSVSLYKPYSKIVAFNNSEKGITIDNHFREIVEKSFETYQQTNGIFDITVLPLMEAWGFTSKAIKDFPDSTTIHSLLACVGSPFLRLEGNFLRKLKPCVRIDLNGIAQGYSVDVVADYLTARGITNYMFELGGELRIRGRKQPANDPFIVGIETPSENEFLNNPLERLLVVDNGGITTSGNYRNYFENGGKKLSHLIDPFTGYSIQNELISVTVFAKDATTADALDNSLMGMGLTKAKDFVEKSDDIAAYFIYRSPEGQIRHWASSRFCKFVGQ
jgi:FAD:protein FMN transferase